MSSSNAENIEPIKLNTFDYYEAAKDFREFSKKEIDVFSKAFQEYDTDGSGTIDAAELKAAFIQMGQGGTDQKINDLIKEYGVKGQIEWTGYLHMMRDFYPWKRFTYEIQYLIPAREFPEFSLSEVEIFVEAFRDYDLDGSGSIDANELYEAFQSMGQGTSREETDQILDEFDEDHSGSIKFSGYLEMMRMFYPFKRIVFELEFYGPTRKFPEWSRAETDVFIWAFKDFDEDASGTIDSKELSKCLNSIGQGVDKNEIQMLINEHGDKETQSIKWPGFFNIMKGFYPYKRLEYEMEFYGPARKFPEFSRKEIDVFSLTFRDFDLDQSGSIDIRELGIAMKKMGQGASQEKLKKIIDDVDDNGNGEIEWVEYLQIMRNFYPYKLNEFEKTFMDPAKAYPEFEREDILVFVEAFRDFDLDGSGDIDVHELKEAFNQMGQGCSEEKLKQIINEVNDNGGNTIDWPAFLKLMRKQNEARFSKSDSKPTKTPTQTPAQTPAKTATTTPSKTSPAPVKASPTPTTPAKTTTTSTASTPSKNTTTTSSPGVKSNTSTTVPAKSSPAPSNTTTGNSNSSSAPEKKTTSFGATKPTVSSVTSSPLIGNRNSVCSVCNKSVYPIEEIRAMDQTFHKGCFKCQDPECTLTLNLKTFKGVGGKVYCHKHVPASKPTQLTVQGSMAMSNAANAPKVQKAQGVKKDQRMTFAPGELQSPSEEEQ